MKLSRNAFLLWEICINEYFQLISKTLQEKTLSVQQIVVNRRNALAAIVDGSPLSIYSIK